MRMNFKVGQSNEFLMAGQSFDLHNCYDYGGALIRSNASIRIWFLPNADYGAGLPSIILDGEALDYFEMSPNFPLRQIRDLDEVGYKNPGDMNLDWLIPENGRTSQDHMVFRFGPEDFLRIHAESLVLRTIAPPEKVGHLLLPD